MKFKALLLLLFSLLFINCSKDDGPELSSENEIISFKLAENGQVYNGTVNHTSKTINVTVSDLDLSNPIVPIIEISNNVSISPAITEAQDFNHPILYTVTAENGDEVIYTVTVVSSDSLITSFTITPDTTNFTGVIDQVTKTITIETSGLELNNSIVPEIEISPNATILPSLNVAQDFTQPVTYTVTAQNGSQTIYTVTTNNTLYSNEKKILSFQFNIDGEVFEGVIDHTTLTINIDTYKNPIGISPILTISPNATITPDSNDLQNFSSDVQYTVTAENQSENIYTVKTKWFKISTINSAISTSNVSTNYYYNASPYIRSTFVDLTIPNSKIVLENDTNSYELNYSNYSETTYNGIQNTSFQIEFPSNIVTATNYTLRYIVDNEIKAESEFLVDVLVENAPDIISSNQSYYVYGDTLILYGINLLPGLRVVANNGSIYQYNQSYMSVNTDATILTFPMTLNSSMFYGSGLTPVVIYYNGRYGETIILNFI